RICAANARRRSRHARTHHVSGSDERLRPEVDPPMKVTVLVGFTVLVVLGYPAFAHRLDEYLQATIISLAEKQVQLSMRLMPGVAVSGAVLAEIDANRDGAISDAEGQAFAERVVHELSLSLDGHPLRPRLVSASFPGIEDMKEGLGEIRIELTAGLPPGDT